MAYRYLIYSTGTTFSGTIVKESATNNPSVNEASLYSNFIIPEIQPLYLWQVSLGTVIPNTEANINAYEASIAPPPQSKDNITYGEVTGMTITKIDKVPTAVAGDFPIFVAGGDIADSGLNAADIVASGSGVTKSQFNVYTGVTDTFIKTKLATTVFDIYSGVTKTLIGTKVDKVTGATVNDIATFAAGGDVQDSGKQFTTSVRDVLNANDVLIPTELAVSTAINTAVASTIKLQGDWDASTNTPNLTSGTKTTGFAWRVSVSGTTALGGITPWLVGDLAVKVAGTGNWIKIANEDIAAIWGNISGSLPDQTDLQNALNAKLATSLFNIYTGVTDTFIKTKLNTALFDIYSGVTDTFIKTKLAVALFTTYTGVTDTFIKTKLDTALFTTYTGVTDTFIKTKLSKSDFNIYSGATDTFIKTKLATAIFAAYTGVTNTLIGTKLATSVFDIYSGATNTLIGTKLDKSAFTGFTASTKNVDKKIQVVSTSTVNANTVAATKITWNSAPVSADTYLWSGGTAVWIKSAGTYEVQYHVLLNNDAANQTHSIGGSLLKNGATEEYASTAGMIVGSNMKAELSLPPTVITLAANDRLDLVVFRIGNIGNVNLVSGLVHLMLNKLT